jgi:DNA-binding transcriptional regulator YhcF (GntR family)
VRDLARELQINPARVSKAYQWLTDAGILCVRRGDGTYVDDAPAHWLTLRQLFQTHSAFKA